MARPWKIILATPCSTIRSCKPTSPAGKAALEGIAPARARPDPRFTFGYFIRHLETRVGPQEYRLGLAQIVPWFGQLALRGRMETAAARAAQQRYEATKLDLIYRVERIYYELYYLERAVQIQRGNVQLLTYLEKVALANYRAGRGTQADVLKIQMELGKLEDGLEKPAGPAPPNSGALQRGPQSAGPDRGRRRPGPGPNPAAARPSRPGSASAGPPSIVARPRLRTRKDPVSRRARRQERLSQLDP